MKVLIGDIFSSNAQTIVNTVNCVGIMGKGVALEFKKRFPDMFNDYKEACASGDVKLGQLQLYKRIIPPWIINFPTKDHWRSVAKLEDIIEGLEYLIDHYKGWGIESLAIPPLGCGLGQLEWRLVGPTLYRYLNKLDIDVELYAPYGTTDRELSIEFLTGQDLDSHQDTLHDEAGEFKPSWIAIVEILRRIETTKYHWPVGRTTFQKLVYVATNKKLPTGLEFRKGSFGPYSPELKNLITKMVNNGLIEEKRQGRMFEIKVGGTFKDASKSFNKYIEQWNDVIAQTADMFARMSTHQAEIVATILFAYKSVLDAKDSQISERELLGEIQAWKHLRRPKLNESEISYNIRSLAALGWIDVIPSADLPLSEEAFLGV